MACLEVNGSHYNSDGEVVDSNMNGFNAVSSYRGLFNFIDNNNLTFSRFGFHVSNKGGKFTFNLPTSNNSSGWLDSFESANNQGWRQSNGTLWNQTVPYVFDLDKDVYLTMVLDGINEIEYLCMNGEKCRSVNIDDSYWTGFVKGFDSNSINSILLGAGGMHSKDWWHLTKMDCYAIRLYSRALTEEEVLENYNMTISYHEFLEKGDSYMVDSN